MSTITVNNPYPFFTDTDGKALENGNIYIGVAGMDAKTNPITAYWDDAKTITAAQPIRTVEGYPDNGGSPSSFFTASDFSITIEDAADVLIYSKLRINSNELALFNLEATLFDDVAVLLADTTTSYTTGTILRTKAEGLAYEVADPSTPIVNEYPQLTAGGVKLFIIPEEMGVTPSAIGATGTGDEQSLIVTWLNVLESSGLTGWIDKDYSFATTITHSGAVKIRAPWSDSARLIYTGTGDGLVMTGAVDLDGVIVDGNLSSSALPTVPTPEVGALWSIHGPVAAGGSYLSGVKIGRIRSQNTRRRTGLLIANLQDFIIGHFETFATYGHGTMLNGLKDGKIGSYSFDKVGNLAAEGSRFGSGIAMLTEGSAGKTPAEWYDSTGIQPTTNVEIGDGQGSRTTDTAVYLHDTYATGITGVSFGHFQGRLIGKDGIKFRDGVTYCSVSSTQIAKVALRGIVIEDAGTDNCRVSGIDIDQAGYDSLGEWLGGNLNYTGGTGEGESLNTVPEGIKLTDSVGSFVEGTVRRVRDAPDDNSEGNALVFSSCTGSTANIVAEDCDGAVRFNALTDCTLRATATDMGRNLLAGSATAAVYCSDAGAESDGNVLEVTANETSGAAVQDYALRINGTGTNFDLTVKVGSSDFNFPSGLVTRSDSAGAVYRGPDALSARGNVTFDGSGDGSITHSAGTIGAMSFAFEGASNYGIKLTSMTTTTAAIRLYDLATGAAVLSTTEVVHWMAARTRGANGWTY